MFTFSKSARLGKNITTKDIFSNEPKNFSPYIQKVMNDLFSFTEIDSKKYIISEREIKLSNDVKLDIVFSDKEFIKKRRINNKAKSAVIIENQFDNANNNHANKINQYITGICTDAPKLKELDYYWFAEDFLDIDDSGDESDVYKYYNSYCHTCKDKFKNVNINFHRIKYSISKINNEIYIVFEDVEHPERGTISIPLEYDKINSELSSEAILGIDNTLQYPSVFESLTERYIYNIDKDNNGTAVYIDGKEYDAKTYPYVKIITKNIFKGYSVEYKKLQNDNDIENIFNHIENIYNDTNMKLDNIIQNPPYSGSLHLQFFENGLDMLTSDGKMIIIEPANWLIQLKPTGEYFKGTSKNHTPQIKKRIEGHVKSIRIENLNKEFGIGSYVPLAITEIDFSKEYKTVECNICGENKTVSSLYDVNLIGNCTIVQSILNKVTRFKNMMKNHITNSPIDGMYYSKFKNMITCGGCALTYHAGNENFETWNNAFYKIQNGYYSNIFIDAAYAKTGNSISSSIIKRLDCAGRLTDNNADCVYGTQSELENWKHFIFNNSLPLFINICLTIDQNNNSKEFLPWLVDKHYTDDEINKLFNFTTDEINLINYTIEKFERNSPWFKRYMCGPESVSDTEVNTFITDLKKKYNITC